ncbi:hypothetical protein GOBAR_AA10826 [Gossypium barbadense]|uniref:Uncharacterized protein n=1 Tax=Gossypium barbadense TaxID=3634 RepID=A0A2P5Y2P4_GOSBA|nr:hypothetical protein GOBAR_AA10826 [Gossypium barbadense]
MEAVVVPERPQSWKDCLIWICLQADDTKRVSSRLEDDDDLDLFDEDIIRSSVNGIPVINFSEREIGGMVGRVAKLDFNTNNGVREYEHLPTVCFSSGHDKQIQDICPRLASEQPKAMGGAVGEEAI